jgi:hypothetical protein
VQAKNTYFSGQPVVDDAMFDRVEERLVRAKPSPHLRLAPSSLHAIRSHPIPTNQLRLTCPPTNNPNQPPPSYLPPPQRFFGSDIVVKYPRCSRRDMKVYSDAEADDEQMAALAGTWRGRGAG